jgi:hypothetical protein
MSTSSSIVSLDSFFASCVITFSIIASSFAYTSGPRALHASLKIGITCFRRVFALARAFFCDAVCDRSKLFLRVLLKSLHARRLWIEAGAAGVNVERPLSLSTKRQGLSDELLVRADVRVRLPMREGISSLNLATSVAATLYGLMIGRSA